MNKRWIFLLLFLGWIPLSCWKQEKNHHFQIDSITIQSFKDDQLNMLVQQTDSLTDSQTFFKLNMNLSYIASIEIFDFSNRLYAFQKARRGGQGLKKKISDIKIYSDKMFNGRSPGENLKSIFLWENHSNGDQNSIDELRDQLNRSEIFLGESSGYVKLILIEKPMDSLSHHLYFNLVYDNGSTQGAVTEKINWK